MFKKLTLWVLFLSLMLGLPGIACSNKEAVDDGRPVVYASFYSVYDLAQGLLGDTVNLQCFMPQDKDPHLWEPTPRDMKRLSKADLLIVNGANMERWLDQVRGALPNLDILVLSDSVELITYKGAAAIGDFQYMCKLDAKAGENFAIDFAHTHEDLMRVAFVKVGDLSDKKLIAAGKKVMEQKGELVPQHGQIKVEANKVYALEMGHESNRVDFSFPEPGVWAFVSDRISENLLPYDILDEHNDILTPPVVLAGNTSALDKVTYDPHSWLSIINGKAYINALLDKFLQKYPEHEKVYRKNKLKLVDGLTDLQYEYVSKFKNVEIREFVTTHYAYAYLARDFNLRQFPLQGLVSTESPSLKTIKKAIDFCKYYGIRTVFYETAHEPLGAKTLAAEIGGKAVPLTSMEYVSPAHTSLHYTDIMRENLERLYESMTNLKPVKGSPTPDRTTAPIETTAGKEK